MRKAKLYRVKFTWRDGRSRLWDRLLRPDEVDDCLEMFNQFSKLNGIVATVEPMRVLPYRQRKRKSKVK